MPAASEVQIKALPLASLYPITVAELVRTGATHSEAAHAILSAHAQAKESSAGRPGSQQTEIQQQESAEQHKKMLRDAQLIKNRMRQAKLAGEPISSAQASRELENEGVLRY